VANYVKATNFAVKDSLLTGNPAKLVKGTEIDTEFNAISSAIATKVDTTVSSLSLTSLTSTNVTTDNLTVNTGQTITGNITFSGNGRKLIGLFGTPHDNTNAFKIQTSVTNTGTTLAVIPNGTSSTAAFTAYASSSDQTNCNYLQMQANDSYNFIDTTSVGTGTTKRLRLDTDGIERLTIAANGSLAVNGSTSSDTSLLVAANGRTYSLQADARVKFNSAYSYTVGATNRTLYIDNGGEIGGLSSTRESKINIAPITDADWLMSLEPVSYNRRERDANGVYTDQYNPNTEFGLIADDVVSVKPELCIIVDGKVSGINYEQLISPMLKEIQKLRAEVNALKEKVNG
jgi:hypothetical protein